MHLAGKKAWLDTFGRNGDVKGQADSEKMDHIKRSVQVLEDDYLTKLYLHHGWVGIYAVCC